MINLSPGSISAELGKSALRLGVHASTPVHLIYPNPALSSSEDEEFQLLHQRCEDLIADFGLYEIHVSFGELYV